ncbi:hypothetical protein BDV97DRAFT_32597 [Delphinella strobiligena]|nr:hypothetical protein BDV97DRAFT_32597 [Delphinella strobiligena]
MSHISDYSPTPLGEQQEQSPVRPSFTPINREESSSADEPAERITPERDVSPGNEGEDQAVDTPVNEDNLASSTITKPSIVKLGKRKRVDHNIDKPVNTEFAERTLQRANFLSSSRELEELASPLRDGAGKTARHKDSVMKASPKPTCTLCEERGIDCTPHPRLPEIWRCGQCTRSRVPSQLCKMI